MFETTFSPDGLNRGIPAAIDDLSGPVPAGPDSTPTEEKKDMSTATARKSTPKKPRKSAKEKLVTDKQLGAAFKKLDKARAANDPHPDLVLLPLLGWWDGMIAEVDRVQSMLNRFRMEWLSSEFRPGFEFARDAALQLNAIAQCLDEGRPSASHRTTDELIDEVKALLLPPVLKPKPLAKGGAK